jgi:hypothetical protein
LEIAERLVFSLFDFDFFEEMAVACGPEHGAELALVVVGGCLGMGFPEGVEVLFEPGSP